MAIEMNDIKVGDKVYYQPQHNPPDEWEKGIVKGIGRDSVFVVYNCNDDWENYQNYTGALTSPRDLYFGWEPEKDKINKFLEKYG